MTESALNFDASAPDSLALSGPKPASRARRITGWVVTALPCALLLFAGAGKLGPVTDATRQGMQHVGVELSLLRPLGVLEIVLAVLCLVPQTAFVGTILFTGWAGGAIMTHLRVGDPFVMQALLPVALWIGLGLRRTSAMKAVLT